MQDPTTTSDKRDGDRGDGSPGADVVIVEEVAARPRGRPDFAFMRPRLSRWIAFGFGSGLSPVAPGTVGTLWAWATFLLLDALLPTSAMWVLIIASFFAGIWASDRVGRDLGVSDHGAIVWDEVVAFWAVLMVVPSSIESQVAAFFVFRAFDVVKPPPIRHFDRTLKNGFGVMFDDILAAFYTLLVFAAWHAWIA
jgi:phosphatidylglycerophosphatase A